MDYLYLIIGLLILIGGANVLVVGASSIAKKMHIPNIIIGLTVVAFGTSFPELMVNIFASTTGQSDLAVGNVLGSNATNILLVVALAAMVRPLPVQSNTLQYEIPFSLLALAVLFVVANDSLFNNATQSVLQLTDGLVFMAFFIIFIYYTFVVSIKSNVMDEEYEVKEISNIKAIFFMLLGFVALYFGGEFIVDSAVNLSAAWGVSQKVIGVLVVALGTSLPELATSVVASYKGNADMAIGNIVGSNIFNIFLVLGVSATISPISFNSSLNFDLGIASLASLLLFIFVFMRGGRRIDRFEGLILLILYIVYVAKLMLFQ